MIFQGKDLLKVTKISKIFLFLFFAVDKTFHLSARFYDMHTKLKKVVASLLNSALDRYFPKHIELISFFRANTAIYYEL